MLPAQSRVQIVRTLVFPSTLMNFFGEIFSAIGVVVSRAYVLYRIGQTADYTVYLATTRNR